MIEEKMRIVEDKDTKVEDFRKYEKSLSKVYNEVENVDKEIENVNKEIERLFEAYNFLSGAREEKGDVIYRIYVVKEDQKHAVTTTYLELISVSL